MRLTKVCHWASPLCFLVCVLITIPVRADWPPISAEELKMTELPQHKGAPAVVLLREEVADDTNNYHSVYMRIKVLTEAGRRYADVEVPYSRRGFRIDSISGRTIHADGSAVPFDGKTFDKVVVKGKRGHGLADASAVNFEVNVVAALGVPFLAIVHPDNVLFNPAKS